MCIKNLPTSCKVNIKMNVYSFCWQWRRYNIFLVSLSPKAFRFDFMQVAYHRYFWHYNHSRGIPLSCHHCDVITSQLGNEWRHTFQAYLWGSITAAVPAIIYYLHSYQAHQTSKTMALKTTWKFEQLSRGVHLPKRVLVFQEQNYSREYLYPEK